MPFNQKKRKQNKKKEKKKEKNTCAIIYYFMNAFVVAREALFCPAHFLLLF